MSRLAILSSHPIQYYAPLFREVARRVDTHVFFAHKATPEQQAIAGFGTAFDWDLDLTDGYSHSFLENVARTPTASRFSGCDTPAIGAELHKGRFDALLVMGWHLKCFLQGLFAAKRLGLPVMVRGDSHLETARSAVKRTAKALLYPSFLRLFDAALYVGQRSRAYYEHYGFPAPRLFFSPHCVDNDWFAAKSGTGARTRLRQELRIAEETRAVLFAGKLVPFKRPRDVVSAVSLVRSGGGNVELLVAGDGELAGQMRSDARALGVPLHLLGFRNQSQMPAAYAAADCLALPSKGETWGLVANEALACGRPIVVSDACGCAPDLAADGHVGRTFKVGDIGALAAAVASVLASPPAPAAISAVAGAHSLQRAADGIVTAAQRCRSR